MFIGKYNKSVILTYIGMCIAVLGGYFAIKTNISASMICLMIAGICDLFDGKFARMCKRDDTEKEFGVQIDSLVDVVSFLAFPVVLGLNLLSNLHIAFSAVLMCYALCGVIRLAWFNLHANKEEAVKYYTGVPVTYIALVLPVIYSILLICGQVGTLLSSIVFLITYVTMGLLFILNFKVIKPKGIWYIIFLILAIVVGTVIVIF